jgi:hypothetical protein
MPARPPRERQRRSSCDDDDDEEHTASRAPSARILLCRSLDDARCSCRGRARLGTTGRRAFVRIQMHGQLAAAPRSLPRRARLVFKGRRLTATPREGLAGPMFLDLFKRATTTRRRRKTKSRRIRNLSCTGQLYVRDSTRGACWDCSLKDEGSDSIKDDGINNNSSNNNQKSRRIGTDPSCLLLCGSYGVGKFVLFLLAGLHSGGCIPSSVLTDPTRPSNQCGLTKAIRTKHDPDWVHAERGRAGTAAPCKSLGRCGGRLLGLEEGLGDDGPGTR